MAPRTRASVSECAPSAVGPANTPALLASSPDIASSYDPQSAPSIHDSSSSHARLGRSVKPIKHCSHWKTNSPNPSQGICGPDLSHVGQSIIEYELPSPWR